MEEISQPTSPTQNSIELLAEIIQLCQGCQSLVPIATQRLCDLIYQIDPSQPIFPGSPNKLRAQKEIEDHLLMLKKNNKPIRPTSVVYRDIAMFLSKKHDLPFDPKTTKKKTDLIQWFDDNWATIRDQFFILLDQHPDNK